MPDPTPITLGSKVRYRDSSFQGVVVAEGTSLKGYTILVVENPIGICRVLTPESLEPAP